MLKLKDNYKFYRGVTVVDIVEGILALILVLIVLVMKDSKSKIIGGLGIGIIIVAKLSAGNEVNGTWIFLIIGIITSLVLISKYKETKKVREEFNMIDKIKEKHSLDEFQKIVEWEQKLRFRVAEQEILLKRQEISKDEYNKRMNGILAKRKKIQAQYKVTDDAMQEYYFFARGS